MIYSLEGKIALKKEKFIVLETGGVGFKVFMSKRALSKISETGRILKIFCFLNVKENGLDLYGFLNREELEFFEILDSIRGVGPKAALEISSLGPLEKIKERILKQDENLFSGIPGIGRKKAMAIIVELSGKIKAFAGREKTSEPDNVLDSLIGLGFSKEQARNALKKVSGNVANDEERLKEALKILGKSA